MPPFASPHQISNPRFAETSQLSYLAENMSLNNNNNHSPSTSNSGGQSPNQNNSPDSPSLSRVDRTAARYAMVDNTSKMQNGNGNKNSQQYSMDESRFGNQMSQPQHQGQRLASPWATNSASDNANASLPGHGSENIYPGADSPIPASFDPSALSYALAVQQAILTAPPPSHSLTSTAHPSHLSQSGHPFQLGSNPGVSNHFQPTCSALDLPQTIITERVLQSASSYAFYRGNGQYTRLVPLDELPPIPGLPSQHQGPMNGCIVLPIPRQHQVVKLPLTTNIWASPLTPGSASTGSSGSGGVGGTGRHFDAFAPLPGGPNTGFGGGSGGFPRAGPRAGTGGGAMRGFNNTPSGRREKIYCDKWVHDGVCAFAQQGCKYKHEMPLDVPTQRSLGLFHGLPSWWKREHGLEMKRVDGGEERNRRSSEVERQREVVRESLGGPVGERGTLSSWRLPVDKRTSASSSSLTQPSAPRAGGLFGNIGSHTTSGGLKSHLSNSYSVLDVDDPTSPASSNGVSGNNNGGIAASMHAPFSPTPGIVQLKLSGGKEANGGGAFSSDKGGK